MRKFFFALLIFMGPALGAQDLNWDDPEFLARRGDNGQFPQTVVKGDLAITLWQEKVPGDENWPLYNFTMAVKEGKKDWVLRKNVLPAVTIPGNDASLFSIALGEKGLLIVSVLQNDGTVLIYSALGAQGELRQTGVIKKPSTSTGVLLAPKLNANPDGSILMFLTVAQEESYQIFSALRNPVNGQWSPLRAVTTSPEQNINFSPSYAYHLGRGYMAYQSRLVSTSTFQIFLKTTDDGGESWSEPKLISDKPLGNISSDRLINQRPFLGSNGNELHLVWEGGAIRNSQVQYALLDREGKIKSIETITNSPTGITLPQLLFYKGTTYITWLDNRSGTFNFFWAYKRGNFWQTDSLPNLSGDSLMVQGAPTPDGLYFFWENRLGNQSSIILLRPDTRTQPPQLTPQDFVQGKRYNKSKFTVGFSFLRDPSGVAGYNYLWTQNPEEMVLQKLTYTTLDKVQVATLEAEGPWYLKAIQQDRAGNWSKEAVLSFEMDKTPPLPVKFILPPRDDLGYLLSNSFELNWEPRSEDTVGYNYRLEYVQSNLIPVNWEKITIPPPGPFVLSATPRASFTNRENGLWALSVLALDEAGNPSEPAVSFFRLGKFIASTRIDDVSYQQDDFGRVAVRINGRGFSTEGVVAKIVIDRDGKAPWDLETTDFQILSDRQIRLGLLDYLSSGIYRLGVIHPNRGLVLSRPLMKVDDKGTIKFGDYSQWGEFSWQFEDAGKWILSVGNVYYWLVLAVLGLWFLLSGSQAFSAVQESRSMGTSMKMINDTLGGRPVAILEKKAIQQATRRWWSGLRFKFTLSILGLTVTVILMLSLTMGYVIIGNSQRSLAQGLKQRTSVLTNSLSRIATIGLKTRDYLSLVNIPNQIKSMDDANYATVTGWWQTKVKPIQAGTNYVWASNDKAIETKIGITLQSSTAGTRPLIDGISQRLVDLEEEVNTRVKKEVGGIQEEMDKLLKDSEPYVIKTDVASQNILADYDLRITNLGNKIDQILDDITTEIFESYPPFDIDTLSLDQKSYVFYKPIIFRSEVDPGFYHGAIRIEVSVASILNQIEASRNQLVQLTSIIAAIAVGLGLLGALILAAITVNPIKIVVQGVERIRNTEDKSELINFNLELKSGDELADLADSINTMAYGLYKAAEAAKDLTVGKDTQKMFINLDKDAMGRKITTASLVTPQLELFGYYEGAKGVSGDYFDYGDLNEDYLYFIKCDVSGKGVPAALIMVEVATIVLNHFRFWDPKKDGVRLAPTVDRINTLLEERGFKGRFAALTLGLLNKKTRKVILCHAGDRDLQIFLRSTGKMETRKLEDVPATGVFPKDLMEMKNLRYKDVVLDLNPGDILFLYTDGIDEAQRKYRDRDFQHIAFMDPTNPATQVPPGTRDLSDGKEATAHDNQELGAEAVHQIIEAIIHRKGYDLVKEYNPIPGEVLHFDFSTLEGTVKDCIIGLAAVEKVFRIYPDPAATSEDSIRVDVKIDDMLKATFEGYKRYFHTAPQVKNNEGEYRHFPTMKEDDQYDDLTLLGIMVK